MCADILKAGCECVGDTVNRVRVKAEVVPRRSWSIKESRDPQKAKSQSPPTTGFADTLIVCLLKADGSRELVSGDVDKFGRILQWKQVS